MKKLLIAAAVSVLAVSSVPTFVGQAHAAIAASPFCKMAGQEKNPIGWDEYYHCFGTPRVERVATRARAGAQQSPFCKMASQEKNPMAWDEFYHCWNR